MILDLLLYVAAGSLGTVGAGAVAKLAREHFVERPAPLVIEAGLGVAIAEHCARELQAATEMDERLWDHGRGAFWFDPARYSGYSWDNWMFAAAPGAAHPAENGFYAEGWLNQSLSMGSAAAQTAYQSSFDPDFNAYWRMDEQGRAVLRCP